MEAEIKKQIIQELIKNNILVEENILSRLDSVTDIELLKKIRENNELILKNDFLEEVKERSSERKVKILWNYDVPAHKRNYNDFVAMFNHRYNALLKILMQRQELQSLVSISRIKGKAERESVALVGIIQDISETSNGNFIITLEDDTGTIKALISKNSQNKELLDVARNMVLDEVVGITGTLGSNIIFINNVLFPEIPLSKELKKSPVEEYALFIGDLHLGSKQFLKKDFEKFLKWLNGEIGNEKQKQIIGKINYLFIVGDIVEGVGVYPGQEKDLDVLDIYEQYKIFIEYVKRIPSHISIIICPGNHDASRITEPQPPIEKSYVRELYAMENVYMVSNPSIINIAATETFSGLDVLLYHGFSFPYYADIVPSIREKGGQERVDLIMKFLLQRRHLAPSHTSTLYIPDPNRDPLVIQQIPDFFVTGHIHRANYSTYKNISLINASAWVGKTEYQEKLGLKPQPSKIILSNLQTRQMKVLNFEEK